MVEVLVNTIGIEKNRDTKLETTWKQNQYLKMLGNTLEIPRESVE